MHVYRILVCRRGFGDYHFTRKSALSPPLHCHLLPKVAFQTSDGLHRERSVRLAGLPAAVEAAFANVSFNIAGSEVSYYGPGAGESGQKGTCSGKRVKTSAEEKILADCARYNLKTHHQLASVSSL